MTQWLTLVEDQDAILEEMIRNFLKDKRYYHKWFEKWKGYTKTYRKNFKGLKKTDLSLLSDKELFSLHKKMWESIIRPRKISMMIDAFTFAAERKMIAELEEFCKRNKIRGMNKIYTILTSPEKESFITKHELALVKLAKKAIKENIPVKRLEELKETKKLLDEYCWIKGNWGGCHGYDIETIKEEIKELLKKELKNIEKRKGELKKNKKNRRKLLKKHKFSEKTIAISELNALFSYWQDLRKENALMFMHYETRFLTEFARRFDAEVKQIRKFDITELEDVLKDRRKFKNELKKRTGLFLILHSQNRLSLITRSKAKYYQKKIITKSLKNISEVKGICASHGKTAGKARIVKEIKEFSKFKEKDILITGMTRPDFAVLMKKAGAIVTDDGGITCHAAIVSRELKKPCIVGTRVATKVFKDGDMVEVDANKGIVRKVE